MLYLGLFGLPNIDYSGPTNSSVGDAKSKGATIIKLEYD